MDLFLLLDFLIFVNKSLIMIYTIPKEKFLKTVKQIFILSIYIFLKGSVYAGP